MDYQSDKFEEILRVVREYTGLRAARLKTLWLLTLNLNEQHVPGHIVECGVRNGGSAAVLAAAMGWWCKIWLYDSFQGLPNTTSKDCERSRQEVGKAVGSATKVHEVMKKVGVQRYKYNIVGGWFKDTFSTKTGPREVALLHCDADFYESTWLALNTFYHRIPKGGYVVMDDFGGWEGARTAFYEFCESIGERPLVERIEESQLWWRKGKQHNRDGPRMLWHNEWQFL